MNRDIGKLIKELREKEGMSQEDLALEIGTSQQTMSFYEKDIQHPKWERLCDIMDVLGYEIKLVKIK